MPLNPQRCSADERNHSRKPLQTLQVLMASFLWRVLSAASLFEFAAQDASLFAVVRPFLHLGFDALVRQIANALLKFPSRVISHRCSPVSRASRPGDGAGGAALRGISIGRLQLGQFTVIPAALSSTARCCPQLGHSNLRSLAIDRALFAQLAAKSRAISRR